MDWKLISLTLPGFAGILWNEENKASNNLDNRYLFLIRLTAKQKDEIIYLILDRDYSLQ
jgi:hypothetical protein